TSSTLLTSGFRWLRSTIAASGASAPQGARTARSNSASRSTSTPDTRAPLRRSALYLAFVVLCVLVNAGAGGVAPGRRSARLGRQPYRFDAGDPGSALEPGAIRLTPSDGYARERGSGWTDGL